MKNISVTRILDSLIFAFQLYFYILKRKKRLKCVIASYPTPETLFVASLFAKNFMLVCDVRDAWPDFSPTSDIKARLFGSYVRFLNKYSFARVDKFISMSGRLRSFVKEYSKKEVKVIPNPIDTEIKKPASDPIKKYNIDISKKFLFFAGTLNSQFDFYNILSAVKGFNKKSSQKIQVIIAGSGEDLNSLKNENKTQYVRFLGQIDNSEIDVLASESAALFSFYRSNEFQGHITNKLVSYAKFKKPILHNVGTELSNGKVTREYGYHSETSKQIEFYLHLIMKGELKHKNELSLFTSPEQFSDIFRTEIFFE